MTQKLPSDLWFSNADSLPWFLEEMKLKSFYDLCCQSNNEKLIEKYGIKRRECVGYNTGCGEYGHRFVFVDKEKFDREKQIFELDISSEIDENHTMSYTFESKRDLLYFHNYIALRKVIEQAYGNGEFVIKKYAEELLDILARNGIKLNPEFLESSKENDQ